MSRPLASSMRCSTAIVTPMKPNGELDQTALRKLAQFQRRHGVIDIVVNGTTGESPTTSDHEKQRLLHDVSNADSSINFIAGCGTNDTRHALQLVDLAKAVGVSLVLLVDPYYN